MASQHRPYRPFGVPVAGADPHAAPFRGRSGHWRRDLVPGDLALRGLALRGLALALSGMALTWSGSALAQLEVRALNDPENQRNLEPFLRFIPSDPHLAIRSYLQKTLPTMWWGREIAYRPGHVTVEVHPPEVWKGNPTSAMMRLCPGAEHNLWRLYQEIEFRPFYQKVTWPAYTCRRS